MTAGRFALISRSTTLVVQPPDVHGRHESRIEDYLRKTLILKQIMSNKARRFRRINAWQNFATVAVSSLLLFFGFSGMEKVTMYVSWLYPTTKQATELGFNLLVFLLFVIGVLHLVFRFPEKQSQAERAVASLAALGNEILDTITSRGNLVISDDQARIGLVRARYESIAENIPANSDREFLRAKRDLARKEERKPRLHVTPQQLFDPAQHERIVSSIVLGSRTIVDVLIALRDTSSSLYLGGGLIRNAVWDYLHGYASPTAVDDVDVIHFDPTNVEKRHDQELNRRLTELIPNMRWSAKNQARMHLENGEVAYASLADAISRWPETATAVTVRLDAAGKLEFVAPYGFRDLLRLIVTVTPPFAERPQVIRDRLEEKRWQETWPRLRVCLPESTIDES